MSVRFRLVNMFDRGRQRPVGDRVPVVEHAVAVADEGGSRNHVGPAVEDGLYETRVLGGVVFQVGVLHDDDVAAGLAEALAQGGGPCPGCAGWLEDPDIVFGQSLEHVAGVYRLLWSSTMTISLGWARPGRGDDLAISAPRCRRDDDRPA